MRVRCLHVKSEDKFVGSVLAFNLDLDFRNQTQVTWIAQQSLKLPVVSDNVCL